MNRIIDKESSPEVTMNDFEEVLLTSNSSKVREICKIISRIYDILDDAPSQSDDINTDAKKKLEKLRVKREKSPFMNKRQVSLINSLHIKESIMLYNYEFDNFNKLKDILKRFRKSDLIALGADYYTTDEFGLESYTALYVLKRYFLDFHNFLISIMETLSDEYMPITIAINNDGNISEPLPVNRYEVIRSIDDFILGKLDWMDDVTEDNIKQIFSGKLRHIAKERGTNASRLASELGKKQQTVDDWFNQKTMPSALQVMHLAAKLNVSVDYLLRNDIYDSNISTNVKYLNLGFTDKALENIKNLQNSSQKEYQHIMNALNVLLENCNTNKNFNTLKSLADYLNPEFRDNHYVVSYDFLDNMCDDFLSANMSQEEIYAAIKSIKGRIEAQHSTAYNDWYDPAHLKLQGLIKELQLLRDIILEDH